MPTVLFPQSEVEDPYHLYEQALRDHPIIFDSEYQLWVVYGYQACVDMLGMESAHIPDPNHNVYTQLNETAQHIAANLLRLQNPPAYDLNMKFDVMQLLNTIQRVSVPLLLDQLLAGVSETFDFVEVVAKRLPGLMLLTAFGFSAETAHFLLNRLDTLVKVMLPDKDTLTIDALNAAAAEAYPLVEQHILQTGRFAHLLKGGDEAVPFLVANLIGLLIQSYDAGRGLLSLALLQQFRGGTETATTFQRVTETLRYDPPVHNTRRILTQPVIIDGVEMKEGNRVLLVLAAANRDPKKFDHPSQYNPLRPLEQQAHLTFGAGYHACLGDHVITGLVVETLDYMAVRYPNLRLLTDPITYESRINVRLPQTMQLAL